MMNKTKKSHLVLVIQKEYPYASGLAVASKWWRWCFSSIPCLVLEWCLKIGWAEHVALNDGIPPSDYRGTQKIRAYSSGMRWKANVSKTMPLQCSGFSSDTKHRDTTMHAADREPYILWDHLASYQWTGKRKTTNSIMNTKSQIENHSNILVLQKRDHRQESIL